MTQSIDSVLTAMSASYEEPTMGSMDRAMLDNAERHAKAKAAHRESKKRAKQNDGSQAAPINPSGNGAKPQVVSIELPPKGTHDAEGFILAMRKAKTRNESIQAIAGFVGYNLTDNFGTQELRAMSAAKLAMRPIVAGKDRTVRETVKGYIAGMPDHQSKHLANLLARERAAAEALADYLKQGKTVLAQVERARIESIRKDIALVG
jgi:hypothetical protein